MTGRVLVFNGGGTSLECAARLPDLIDRGFLRPDIDHSGEFRMYRGKRYLATEMSDIEAIRQLYLQSVMVPPAFKIGAKLNGWSLRELIVPDFTRGYCSKIITLDPYKSVGLFDGESLWMSLMTLEYESLALSYFAAHGHVVIMGLGMGLLLRNVLGKGDVTDVTVIEQDATVVRMLEQFTDIGNWPGVEKFRGVHIADALEWKPGDEHVDVVLIDIWRELGHKELRPHTQQIHANVGADSVHAWGQELDYLTWCGEQGYKPPPTWDQFREYTRDIGVPLFASSSHNYPELAFEAGRLATLRKDE